MPDNPNPPPQPRRDDRPPGDELVPIAPAAIRDKDRRAGVTLDDLAETTEPALYEIMNRNYSPRTTMGDDGRDAERMKFFAAEKELRRRVLARWRRGEIVFGCRHPPGNPTKPLAPVPPDLVVEAFGRIIFTLTVRASFHIEAGSIVPRAFLAADAPWETGATPAVRVSNRGGRPPEELNRAKAVMRDLVAGGEIDFTGRNQTKSANDVVDECVIRGEDVSLETAQKAVRPYFKISKAIKKLMVTREIDAADSSPGAVAGVKASVADSVGKLARAVLDDDLIRIMLKQFAAVPP